MGETVEKLVRRRSGTDRWKADAAEVRAVIGKGTDLPFEFLNAWSGLCIFGILAWQLQTFYALIPLVLPLAVWIGWRSKKRLNRGLEERFGKEEGAAHVSLVYRKYDSYGADVGVLFLDEGGALVFDGIASGWVLPPGAGRRAENGDEAVTSVLRVETVDGGRYLEITSTGTWEQADPILAAYWAHPPTRAIAEVPLSRQPGYGG